MTDDDELRRYNHLELLLRYERGGDLDEAFRSFEQEFALFMERVRRFHALPPLPSLRDDAGTS